LRAQFRVALAKRAMIERLVVLGRAVILRVSILAAMFLSLSVSLLTGAASCDDV
jgi:hypothetical protein